MYTTSIAVKTINAENLVTCVMEYTSENQQMLSSGDNAADNVVWSVRRRAVRSMSFKACRLVFAPSGEGSQECHLSGGKA